ncbi:MAG: hypothetical protein GY851_30520 [bacterium]|nr:hypothetical protein [bacterium]
MNELQSLHESDDPGVRHFSGIATYRATFAWDGPADAAATLDLGQVAEVCRVRVNDQNAGIGWHEPYRFDLGGRLKRGENAIKVEVANLWHNRIAGDARLPKGDRVTRVVPETHYERMGDAKLVASGLIGPVRILTH